MVWFNFFSFVRCSRLFATRVTRQDEDERYEEEDDEAEEMKGRPMGQEL